MKLGAKTSIVLCTSWYTNRQKTLHKPRKFTLGIHHTITIVTNTKSTVTLPKVNKVEKGASYLAHFYKFFIFEKTRRKVLIFYENFLRMISHVT